jgi:hypothetical protein
MADEIGTFLEASLWKQKKGSWSTHWKQKWIRVDQKSLSQWYSASRPKTSEKARHVFDLGGCELAEGDSRTTATRCRKYSFSLRDKDGHLLVLAADSNQTYHMWFDFIQLGIKRESEEVLTPVQQDALRLRRLESAQRIVMEEMVAEMEMDSEGDGKERNIGNIGNIEAGPLNAQARTRAQMRIQAQMAQLEIQMTGVGE